MSLGLNKTKRRIASVKGTQKITKAMGTIAAVKLGRLRTYFENGKAYESSLREVMRKVYSFAQYSDAAVLKENEEASGSLYIVISSSLGLCASYNTNIFKFLLANANEEDTIAPIGSKAVLFLKHSDKFKNVIYDFLPLSGGLHDEEIIKAGKLIRDLFLSKKYKSIYIVYTKFINSLKNEPAISKILPMDKKAEFDPDLVANKPFFEPAPKELLDYLLPQFLNIELRNRLTESFLSEQSSRRVAMDNANDNADEILDKLTIEYNKARQAAITQEITEVVSGANAQ